jgi:hypothetical protein
MVEPHPPSTQGLHAVIGATFRKYSVIFIGYAVSLAVFMVSSLLDPVSYLGDVGGFLFDRVVFGTMLFCGFLIVYLVREFRIVRLESKLKQEQRLREGVQMAEREVRNQIILIHQAAYVLSEKGEYDEDVVRGIRENALRMDKQLDLLQSEDIAPVENDSENSLVLF